MERLRGRVALVTGAASGLGAALARALSDAGMMVVLTDVQAEPLARVAADVRAGGGKAWFQVADLLDPGSIEELVSEVYERSGPLHLLVNNAGVMSVAPLVDTTEEDWSWLLGVNLLGAVRVIRAVVPRMRAAGAPAHIVNVASMSGIVAAVETPVGAYAASKGALISFSEVLARELESDGIRVSVVCPGGTHTSIFEADRHRPRSHWHEGVDRRVSREPADIDSASLMSAAEAAGRIVDGIRSDRRYIFTHTDQWERLEAHWESLRADFDAARRDASRAT